MRTLRTVIVLLMVFAAWSWSEAQEPSKEGLRIEPSPQGGGLLHLSLQESIQLALKHNLDIAIEGFNPQIRDEEVMVERAVFDPSAFVEGDVTNSATPNRSLLAGVTVSRDLAANFNLGFRQKLPTGGSYEFRFNNNRDDSNARFLQPPGGINPAYASDVTITLTQPLLKGFGIDINLTRVRIAQNNRGISQENLRARANGVITDVEGAYWDLVAAIQNLEVQRRSLRLAKELMELNKARVRAGVAAPVEVTQAEAEAAAREKDVIQAEKGVKDAEDRLKLILNIPDDRIWGLDILPSDMPPFKVEPVDLPRSLEEALSKRPEVQKAKIDIQSRDLNLRLARNQLLPRLDLQGSVGVNGLNGAYSGNLDKLVSGDFNTFSVGVVLEVPIGNRAARANFLKAKLEADQAQTSLRSIERTIVTEVREAVRRVEAATKVVNATREARRLAEEQLRVEQKRLEAGVTTTFNVLRFQRDLTEAQANEVTAIAEYNKSLANLEKVKGTILEKYKLEL